MNVERSGNLYLGTQGFSFDDWVGPFYPAGTSKTAYLEQYAERLPAVEIDSTFYGVPRATTVQKWRERTPPGFRFAAKFPKLITHEKKLDRALGDAEEFIGTMQALGDKLAVLVLQFAYDFTPDLYDRLDSFLAALPGGTRYAVEVRNRGWLKPELREMLSQHNAALVLQDLHYMPKLDWITADFTVIRWLGRRKDIARFDEIQIDRSQEMGEWAQKVSRFLSDGVNVYGFFNNHFAGHSPASVRQFAALLGVDLMEHNEGSTRGTQMAMEFEDE
ncbi:MAG: DUF72 domain-containing protein [Anaerolineales bacterium]|nr:MAG: DUF72 domain-containing protein [Anaerolineales bacterium]